MPVDETRYFISYTREDADFVLKLAKELRAAGANLWLDQLYIMGGQRWDRAVEEALATCHSMIVVLSPESVASHNVMDEVSYALEENKLVVPVLYKACSIPFRLRRVQRIDFTTNYDTGFADLLRALGIEQLPTTTEPPEPEAPPAKESLEETSSEVSVVEQAPVTTETVEGKTQVVQEVETLAEETLVETPSLEQPPVEPPPEAGVGIAVTTVMSLLGAWAASLLMSLILQVDAATIVLGAIVGAILGAIVGVYIKKRKGWK